ncbi:hypothetical protein [Pseudomonas sp. NA-150]|uniref:hypothetical protein n=1 Tax=Pseudomonas sp. NA-150 TaxID=3367525 RepID=UPI0037C5AD8C
MSENIALQEMVTPIKDSRSFSIYKMIFGVLVTTALVVGTPVLAEVLGDFHLADKAVFVLVCTAVGLVVKIVIGDTVAGEFLFYKFGYDNCVIAFGALLTALALQILSPQDLFPGLQTFFPHSPSTDMVLSRQAELFTLFLIALGAMVFTARIASDIKQNRAKYPSLLALLNSLIGTMLLAVYILILITKG